MINGVGIVINGDDFGFNPLINRAIIESFNRKLINSATIMANMSGCEEAIELAHNNKIINNIGVHLVLTEGSPITDKIRRVDYLFNGRLDKSTRLRKLFYLNKNEKELIYNEYAAQIEKIRKSHINITHLDTHHQIHDMLAITRIIIALLKDFQIPKMRILNNLEKSNSRYKNIYRNLINHLIRVNRMNLSYYFGNQIDFIKTFGERFSFSLAKEVEIMVHPIYNNDGILIDRIGKVDYDYNFLENLANHSI